MFFDRVTSPLLAAAIAIAMVVAMLTPSAARAQSTLEDRAVPR
jgi:hypothetical protein